MNFFSQKENRSRKIDVAHFREDHARGRAAREAITGPFRWLAERTPLSSAPARTSLRAIHGAIPSWPGLSPPSTSPQITAVSPNVPPPAAKPVGGGKGTRGVAGTTPGNDGNRLSATPGPCDKPRSNPRGYRDESALE